MSAWRTATLKATRCWQSGVAIITVLMALAIAVLIASEIMMRVYGGMRRSTSQLHMQQAWQYALAGEAAARQYLHKDYEKDKKAQRVDHINEEWAKSANRMPVDDGFIEYQLFDLQSRFNLNNLVDDSGQIVPEQVAAFKRLLAWLGVNTAYADLAAAWASTANDTGNAYGRDPLLYRAGDTLFGSVSELRLLRDMSLADYRRIAPFVCVLPESGTAININTAPAPVLASLLQGNVPPEKLQQFIAFRSQQVNGVTSPEMLAQMTGSAMGEEETASVNSEYFELRARGGFGEHTAHLISVLRRDQGTGEILLYSRDNSQSFALTANRDDAAGDNSKTSHTDSKSAADSKKDQGLKLQAPES